MVKDTIRDTVRMAIETSHQTGFTPTELTAWGTAIGGIVTGGLALWYKYFGGNGRKKTDKLVNCSLFSDLKRYRNKVQYNFSVEDKTKQEVYKDLLIKKIDAWYSLLYKLAEDIDKKCIGCNGVNCSSGLALSELQQMHNNCLLSGIDAYNNYYNNADYTEAEKDLCKYAVEKFNVMHAGRVELVESVIGMLNENFSFDQCPKSLTAMVFTAYNAAFILAFKDMDEVINASNGYFIGKDFRRRAYSFAT
jgi:hypothetical protein